MTVGPGRSSRTGGAQRADHTIARRPLLDTPADYLITLILVVAVVATVGTWITGQTAGLLFHQTWPHVTPGQALTALTRVPHTWSDPKRAWPIGARADLPGAAGFATSAVLVLLLSAVAATYAIRFARPRRRHRIRGWAAPAEIHENLSPRAALARVSRLRPGLDPKKAHAMDVCIDLGNADGIRVAAPIDSSVLLLAAARIGKTSQFIVPAITDFPGPVLNTSVRTDVVLATAALRQRLGPVAVMDLTGTRWPNRLAWSPASRCEQFDIARRRADVMVTVGKADTGPSDSTNAAFFGLTATNLLAGWLHAVALTGRTMSDVLGWALDERQDEPIRLLRDHPQASPGVAAMLDGIYRSPAETRSNMWTTVMTAVAPLLSETARAAFSPAAGEGFDVSAFLHTRGTVYLIVPDYAARDLAPLVTAFVEEITETAARLAAIAPAGRLDPPLGLLLDEVANVVPLPRLPQLMSYAGGTGIFTAAILQDIAQARQRWGRHGAEMIWGAATVRIALGGLGGDELTEFSRLAGQYRESLTTTQRGSGGATWQTTLTDRPVISPEQIRMLSETSRHALILHATTPPIITRMTRHYEGPRGADHEASVRETRALLTDTITPASSHPGPDLTSTPDGPGRSRTKRSGPLSRLGRSGGQTR